MAGNWECGIKGARKRERLEGLKERQRRRVEVEVDLIPTRGGIGTGGGSPVWRVLELVAAGVVAS
jgi:hypothetical protein